MEQKPLADDKYYDFNYQDFRRANRTLRAVSISIWLKFLFYDHISLFKSYKARNDNIKSINFKNKKLYKEAF